LYSTRLHWSGKHGFAKLHGVLVALQEPPRIGGEVVFGIDYIPEVGMRTIALMAGSQRDMREHEVSEADAFLRLMTI
jgi:hypothetical protein